MKTNILKVVLGIIAICNVTIVTAQERSYDYLGVIKLNDSAFIPYRLAFEEIDGQITGYSLSDMGGAHETKSNIKGTYDETTQQLLFREYDVVYTKSPSSEFEMCLVNFEGKVKNLNKNKAFSGGFNGFYPDGTKCVNGLIIVSNTKKVEKRAEKLDRRIQKTKRLTQEQKEQFSLKRALDTISMSTVKVNETLNIFTTNNDLTLTIYDSGKVDDDRIRLLVNGEEILADYSIVRKPKQIPIRFTAPETKIEIIALNEGESAPNTVKIELKDGVHLITTRSSLKKGEVATLSLIK